MIEYRPRDPAPPSTSDTFPAASNKNIVWGRGHIGLPSLVSTPAFPDTPPGLLPVKSPLVVSEVAEW